MTRDAALFDAPILRGLGARDREAVLEAARFASHAPGASIYDADAPADSVFVVVRGVVQLSAQRRGAVAASTIRRARTGESFGEEALLFGGARRITASALERAEVCEVPAALLERVLGRGDATVAKRELRFAERRAIADLLKTAAFASALSDIDFDILLDGAQRRRVERGARVYSKGEDAGSFFLIMEGLVQLQRVDGETRQVCAYLERGDFFGDEEIARGERRALDAVATGVSELCEVPAEVLRTLSDRNPRLLSRVRRIQTDRAAAQASAIPNANATQHVLRDVYRMQMARSLLVIDQDTCVRCGHCAWTCESLHGVSRLVRRGDKVVTALAVADAPARSLMLPSSCQHCKNPLCMVDCPTGAIGRDPQGEVFIREELCTGCGNCAKACPWENIRMAPRDGVSAELAVKCDLCRGYEAPACVQACPTESIFRLEPTQDIREVAALFGGTAADREVPAARGVGWVALAAGAGIGLGAVGWWLHARAALDPGRGVGLAAGWLTLALLAALVLYAVPKRVARLWMRRGRSANPPASRVRPFYRAHLAIGASSVGALVVHAGPHLEASAAGALGIAFWLASGLGVLGVVLYRVIPKRLARLERKGALPEDLGAEREALLDRMHRDASGRSELVKRLLDRVLLPYARAASGPWSLVLSGRALRDEEAALRGRVDALLEGRGAGKLDGLDALIRTAVELRALPARVWLGRALRGWLIAHIIVTAVVLALLAVHLAGHLP